MGKTAWYGVDLDGTLAYYDYWHGEHHIGTPIPAMIERVKRHLAHGDRVKIFTARASEPDPGRRADVIVAIQDWCEKHVGARLEVTCTKDYGMVGLYDDRAIQIVPNEGRRADGEPL